MKLAFRRARPPCPSVQCHRCRTWGYLRFWVRSLCLRAAGNRVTIFGAECTSLWVQPNLPVPGPAAIICDSSKEKKKDKFASLKPLQTWNFLPPCSVLVLDMYTASPASQHHQFGSSLAAVSQLSHQYRLLDYGRNHLYNYRSPGCLLCSQRRGELAQPLPKGAFSCSTQFGTLDGYC